MVQDDPKLLDDSGEAPNLNRVVGSSIPGSEIVYLLDIKLAKWSNAFCVSKKNPKTKLTIY